VCGIFGFTGPPDTERLDVLRLALLHRGPDGCGAVVLPRVTLGCDRLAIVCPADGAQPLASEDGRLQLVCNGEIYNHLQLRRELEARGHRFATGSDAEVVVHAYEDEGAAAFARLHGMFALALWDDARQRLVLARDSAGMKSLFYVRHDGRWWFASEAKALLALGVERRLDVAALDGLLRLGFVPGSRTMFEGISRLPAGCTWTLGGAALDRADGSTAGGNGSYGTAGRGRSDGMAGRDRSDSTAGSDHGDASPRIDSFDSYPAAPSGGAWLAAGGTQDELAAELRRRLAAAVASHLAADVPVGASLSGGLDSSLLVGLMAEIAGPGVKTFAIGAAGDQDERPFARRVAECFRTDHCEIAVTPEALWAHLPRVIWNAEEPRTGPLVPNHLLFARAARDVRVLLLGEGADELFGGYLRFKTALPPLDRLPQRLAAALYGTRKLGAAASRLYGTALTAARASQDPLAAYLGPALAQRGPARLQALLDYERRIQLPNAHLARVDLLSMAHAVEARLPYLDPGVIDLAARTPPTLKVAWRSEKMLLRQAARGLLPAAILERRKQGQRNPFRLWEAAGVLDLAAGLLSEPALRARGLFQPREVGRLLARLRRGRGLPFDRHRMHLLVLLEVWHRVFLDPAWPAPPQMPSLAGVIHGSTVAAAETGPV
jgi:asparagine synthase (glutamine-hydrolysing)